MQTLRKKIEILIQLYSRNHLRPLRIFIPTYHVRIRIGIRTIFVIAKHDVFDTNMFVIHRVISWKQNWIGVNDLLVNGITTIQRTRIISKVAGETNSKLSSRSNVYIDIRPQSVCFLVDIVIKSITFVNFQDTGILSETTCHIICCNSATTPCRNICTIC